jgi:hypothetical protein
LNLTCKDSDLVRENGQPVFPIQQQSGIRLAINLTENQIAISLAITEQTSRFH